MSAESLRVQIECRIARGWSTERICTDLRCSPAAVESTRRLLDAIAAEDGPAWWEPLLPKRQVPVKHRETFPPRQTQPKRPKVAVCGTRAGFMRHRYQLLEPACGPCREADRAYQAERHQRRKGAA